MLKQAEQEVLFDAEFRDRYGHGASEREEVGGEEVREAVVLRMVPDTLDGIEIRRIRREPPTAMASGSKRVAAERWTLRLSQTSSRLRPSLRRSRFTKRSASSA